VDDQHVSAKACSASAGLGRRGSQRYTAPHSRSGLWCYGSARPPRARSARRPASTSTASHRLPSPHSAGLVGDPRLVDEETTPPAPPIARSNAASSAGISTSRPTARVASSGFRAHPGSPAGPYAGHQLIMAPGGRIQPRCVPSPPPAR
jgi:hypothetical protein